MTWIASLAAFVAVAAAIHAWRSASRLRAAAGRATAGAARGPALSVSVLDADARLARDGTSQYALLLAVANGTPVPRTFTAIDLRIQYRTASNFTGAIDVALAGVPDAGGTRTGEITLRLPLTLEAEQVLIGWAHFASGDGLGMTGVPRDARVDGYRVVLTGNTGERLAADATAVTLRQAAPVSATAPA